MKKLKFKTTIKCLGCVAKVTPILDAIIGGQNWEVDLTSPDRILTITAPETLADIEIITAIEKVGFKATKLA
ncbi:MAG: copper chaperone [Bacteroidetes bacterium]|nr:copper chaperone [Bacteroidota bacterium]